MIQYIITISPLLLLASSCDNEGFVELPNGKCYKMFKNYVDIHSATTACAELNTQLVTIKTADDNNVIADYMIDQHQSSAWIGLTCISIDNCEWVDGSALSYKHFLYPNPDISQGECYYMRTGNDMTKRSLWLNANCNRMTNYFICEEKMKGRICPKHYVEDPSSNKCFKAFYDAQSFPYAEQMCMAEGGHLASIHIFATNDFLFRLLRRERILHAWIGLRTDDKSQVSWTDGTPTEMVDANVIVKLFGPQKAFYYSAQPDKFAGKWFGVDGNSLKSYLCEKKKELPTPTIIPAIQTTTNPTRIKCGAIYFEGQSGRIVSPNYPYNFSVATCNYLITGSSNVVNVQIPAITATKFWTISVYDGDEPNPPKLIKSIYYGEENEIDISSMEKTMFITFYSEPSNRGSAFSILYSSTTDPLFPTRGTISPTLAFTNPVNLCRAGFLYDENSENCFLIGPPLSFADSQKACAQQMSNLLSIHSRLEEENLMRFLENAIGSKNERVWLGANYNGNWKWTDGSPWDFSDWILDAPELGHCAIFAFSNPNFEGWFPKDCRNEHWFICYTEPIN